MKSYEEKAAQLEKELDDVWVKFSEDIQAKDEEAITKEARAYVKAHGDLFAKLIKCYPDEDFAWLEELAPGAEAESEGEEEREEGVNVEDVTKEQARENPPTE